jgi:hypothetical protein
LPASQIITELVDAHCPSGRFLSILAGESQTGRSNFFVATSDFPELVQNDYMSPFNNFRELGRFNFPQELPLDADVEAIPNSEMRTTLLGRLRLAVDTPVFVLYLYGEVSILMSMRIRASI